MSITLFLAPVTTALHAQNGKDSYEEFDAYKLRVSAFLYYSNPSGDIQGSHDADMIDLQKDFSFNSYSTFTGKVDWKFTHKNHFYLVGSDFNQTRQSGSQENHYLSGSDFPGRSARKRVVRCSGDRPGISVRHYPAQARTSRRGRADRSF